MSTSNRNHQSFVDEESSVNLRSFYDDDNLMNENEAYPDTIDDIKARKRSRLHFGLCLVLLFCMITVPVIVTKVGLSDEKAKKAAHTSVFEEDDDDNTKTRDGILTEEDVTNILAEFGISKDRSFLQDLAFEWLMGNRDLSHYPGMQIAHRFALACFYYSSYQMHTARTPDPPTWASHDLWMEDSHECDWYGITCNQQRAVTEINLPNNNLTGRIATELGVLHSTLERMDLSDNQLYMDEAEQHFSTFLKLSNLQELHLHDNHLSSVNGIPTELSKLTKLTSLDVSFNEFKGQFHAEEYVNMTQLQHLQMQGNDLSGHLEAKELAKLTNLESLDVRDNKLQTELWLLAHGKELSKLSKLWMENNELMGSIPTAVGSMTALTSLNLMNGVITGTIPTEIGLLTKLERLWLGRNKFKGSIPSTLKDLDRLEVLELQGNDLVGSVPLNLCQSLNASTYAKKRFTADCESGNLKCECCTECF